MRSWSSSPRTGRSAGSGRSTGRSSSASTGGTTSPSRRTAPCTSPGRPSAWGNDLLLLKFAPDGAHVWQRSWDGGGQETGEGVAVAGDGSVYVTGTTDSFGGFGHLVVLRFAPDGTLVWQRIRDVATDAAVGAGQAIAVGADGSIYAAGVVPRASSASSTCCS
jgi:hypothetical protein